MHRRLPIHAQQARTPSRQTLDQKTNAKFAGADTLVQLELVTHHTLFRSHVQLATTAQVYHLQLTESSITLAATPALQRAPPPSFRALLGHTQVPQTSTTLLSVLLAPPVSIAQGEAQPRKDRAVTVASVPQKVGSSANTPALPERISPTLEDEAKRTVFLVLSATIAPRALRVLSNALLALTPLSIAPPEPARPVW